MPSLFFCLSLTYILSKGEDLKEFLNPLLWRGQGEALSQNYFQHCLRADVPKTLNMQGIIFQ